MAGTLSPKLLGDVTLKNKIILVTGAGTGINLAFAKLTHQQGAKILIADLKLTQDAEDFIAANKHAVKFQQCDVTIWSQLEHLFPTCVEAFGDVPDIVIPGAGVFDPPWSDFWGDKEAESYKTLEINVSHVIKLTRLAIRAFAGRNRKGVVCPIASQAGITGFYLTPLYCATKHAVVGFVRSMGPAEPLEGVKVVTVCPGAVKTDIWNDKRALLMIDETPTEKIMTPERVAEAMIEVSLIPSRRHSCPRVTVVKTQSPRICPSIETRPPSKH